MYRFFFTLQNRNIFYSQMNIIETKVLQKILALITFLILHISEN